MSRESSGVGQRVRSWVFASLSFSALGFAVLSLGLGFVALSFVLSPANAAVPVQRTSFLERFSLPSLEKTLSISTVTRPSQPELQPSERLQAFTRSLKRSQVIYLGETHDSERDHRLQLEVLQALQAHNPKLILAMEMFQRPIQSVLDRYLKGELSEEELVDRSEYNTRWGFPWELYAPMIRFSQSKNIPMVALNTPTEVTRKVSRKGLERLTLADRRFIPPISEIQVGPAWYRDRIEKIYTEMHQGKGNSDGLTRFFQAQVLWDETMADGIAHAVRQYPNHQIVVLVGQGHLLYGDGIPDRVMRRVQNQIPEFSQMTLLLNPDLSFPMSDSVTKRPIADWLWHSTPDVARP